MKTKVKLLLSLSAAFILAGSVKAQVFSGGIMGGVSTSAVRIENVGNQFSDVLQGKALYGFETGVFAKFMLSPFYLKPMALYNFAKGDVSNVNDANSTSNFAMSRFEAPILFGFKILGPLSIEAGPVYNYIIQSTSQMNGDNNVNVAQGSGLGYRVGVALEVNRFLMNLSYGGVTINSNGVSSATFKEPYKIVFGIGIKLGKVE